MTRNRDVSAVQNNLGGAVPPIAAGKNAVINGGFDIWQRGTSFAGLTTYAYTADRWKVLLSGVSINATLSQDTSVPNVRSKYSAKLQQLTSNATSVGEFGFHQIFETSNILPLCGNTVTLSFWYKSSITGTHYYRIYTAYQTGGVDTTSTFTVSVADTWEYKTITLSAFAAISAVSTAPTAAGAELQIGPRIYGSPTGTISANGYAQISQVQLEVGSSATPFARAGGNIQGELAACQRYYWRSTANGNNNQVYGGGFAGSTTAILAPFSLPSQMRTVPTVIGYANIYVTDEVTNFTPSNLVANSRTSVNILQIQPTVSGATQFRPYLVVANGTAGSYIDASAEL